MRERGQRQEAGEGSQQIQVAGDIVVHAGITEERAREIMRASAREEVERHIAESQAVAAERIGTFDDRLMERLIDSGLLGALADPAIQVSIRKAQIGAASTERSEDYDLLASLIEERIRSAGERHTRAALNRSVEIVDELETSALRGLTMAYLLMNLSPTAPDPRAGIAVMAALVKPIVEEGPLPVGTTWLEHLDLLDAIRMGSAQFRAFESWWPQKTHGYVCEGVDPSEGPEGQSQDGDSSVRDSQALTRSEVELQLWNSSVVRPHPYLENRLRLPWSNVSSMRQRLNAIGWKPERTEEAVQLARDVFRIEAVSSDAVEAYMRDVRADAILGPAVDWFVSLRDTHFVMSVVGRVLAISNLRRLGIPLPDGLQPIDS